ncbi:NUDIX domain-containing protein [Paenibacillus thermoaerophilus]|uniref:NUDIX domain-containing protein n=1 Tax=Paenibacillus thermoaerophilus TaxID=1215385 RepID=A0ABW2V363_9BACL|nr:NUDIX domain-containing protein [Paenibacillus thermoaerophilus]TMV18406.1 NUDIX domain-containing protein [Paenibacillus thermoaerophilus]
MKQDGQEMRFVLFGPERRYSFVGAYGHSVELTMFPEDPEPAGHVVLLVRCGGGLLFARHSRRGLEWPGGKVEPGETPLEAALRELREETGGSAESVWFVGQYVVHGTESGRFVKNVYAAVVRERPGEPTGDDTDGAEIVPIDVQPSPERGFSPLVCDPVFAAVRSAVLGVG